MTYVFNMHEAKSKLSRLIELMESGEEVILARDGVRVARLTPETKTPRPKLGEFIPIIPELTGSENLSRPGVGWEENLSRKNQMLLELLAKESNEQPAA
ncbi:hypothetical protein HRU87_00505 [Aquiluna borgnonia]|uniref:Antitoxin n=1 Tax=Aquiluna borgnonia TaxID=2499157 RepID=A0A7D4Q3F4_9MICO|nr:hypothetical protein [Aquiluna borgnonia]QKJ24729.1 hypothetical protein HRU87_00505 [Aquiluna borgnonia]